MAVDLADVDPFEAELFLDLVAHGIPALNAGIEVNWTPRKTNAMCADPDFAELIEFAKDRADGRIVKKLYEKAEEGVSWAVQMWLFNRRPNEWKDIKRIEVRSETNLSIGIVHSVKRAAYEMLGESGPAMLQAGGPLDDDIAEGEIVEDGAA